MNTPPAAADRLRRLLPLLLVASMMSPLTLNILMPSLPALAVTINAPRETVQLTLSLYLIGMAASQIIVGPLADRYGRRPVMIASALIFCIASFVGTFATSIEMIILARVAQALGATGGVSLSRTIISDLSSREDTTRMIAYVTMTMVLAPMAAPSIGSLLDQTFGWQAIFGFCAVMGGAVGLYATVLLNETRPAGMERNTASDVMHRTLGLLRTPKFLRYAITSAAASASFFTFLGGASHLVIEAMKRPPAEYGYWFVFMGLGYATGNFTSARLSHRYGIEKMIGAGNALLMIGILAMGAFALWGPFHPASLFLPAMLVTYGCGLVMPHANAGAIQIDLKAAGAASGIMGFTQMGLGAFTSYLVSKLPGETAIPMIGIMLATGTLAFVLSPPRFRSR